MARRPGRPRAVPAASPASLRRRALRALELLEARHGAATWEPRYDPVSELVFTILSQHTSDVNAERAFLGLRGRFPSWQEVARAEPEAVAREVRVAGLGNLKAPRIQGALQRILELRGGLELGFLRGMPLPEAKAWLRALPGVGPKTAAIVLSFSLGMEAMPVDTHVYRVTRRLGLVGPRVSAEDAHDLLEGLVPGGLVFRFHVAVIAHGRGVCRARRPLCSRCALWDICPSRQGPEPGPLTPPATGRTLHDTAGAAPPGQRPARRQRQPPSTGG